MHKRELLRQIRGIDLYYFLLKYDPNGWRKINNHQIKGMTHDSCIVTKSLGWSWFSRGLFSRNPIDFLIEYYGVNFQIAFKILSDYAKCEKFTSNHNVRTAVNSQNKKQLPKASLKSWKALYSYLCYYRFIDKKIVDDIVAKELAFQTIGKYPNICFLNPEKNHWEIVGTSSSRYKRISDALHYWILPFSFNKCFVSESAIDAISLYELLKDESASYVSIGGAKSRFKLIRNIIEQFEEVVLALDNDDAGNETAALFPQCKRIIPYNKDFNEDLIYSKKQNMNLNYKLKKEGTT
ncbi:MAG: toprim domain-containing protein [Phascolarctobacterium sp.]|nr:toprim domain-containing protein [Phascolarctobacterium sp.]